MKKYTVRVYLVLEYEAAVEAESPEQAEMLACDLAAENLDVGIYDCEVEES